MDENNLKLNELKKESEAILEYDLDIEELERLLNDFQRTKAKTLMEPTFT